MAAAALASPRFDVVATLLLHQSVFSFPLRLTRVYQKVKLIFVSHLLQHVGEVQNTFLTVLTDEDMDMDAGFTRGSSCPAGIEEHKDERRTTATSRKMCCPLAT